MQKALRLRKYLSHQFIWVNLLAFVLPLLFKLTPAFILFFVIIVLYQSKFKWYTIQLNNRVWFFSILYLLYVFGAFYTSESQEILPELETKFAILVFPILFLFTKPLPKTVMNKVLLNFVLGCLINTLVSVYKGWSCFQVLDSINCFYSSSIAFSFHPSYLALYLNISIAILLYFDLHKLRPYYISRWMIWVMIVLFSFFLVLLSSKMGIIGLFLVIISFFLYHLKIVSWKRTIYKSLVPALIFTIGLLAAPMTQTRIKKMVEVVKTETNNAMVGNKTSASPVVYVESNATRLQIWMLSLDLIRSNMIFGLGTGDVSTELVKMFGVKGMKQAQDLRLNAHNQFIETTLAIGILGFLLLISYFIIGLYLAIKRKSFLYMAFLLLCGAHFSVESMLETQAGVVFFAFFNALFYTQLNHVQTNEGNNRIRS